MPTFGSLFAGIGGIDLGLERAGWECRFQVEWDAYCQRVLAKHWPDVPRYGDIHDVHGPLAHGEGDGRRERWAWRSNPGDTWELEQALPSCPDCLPRVDLLAGGFPCQPFSVAGKQRRLDDDRWLWPEFARTIRELRPRYVLVENVPGLLVGGGMDAVLGDLAELGYDTEWESIPAAAVGAPHLRYRVWIIAYRQADSPRTDANGERPHRAGVHVNRSPELRDEQVGESGSVGGSVPHPNGGGRQGERSSRVLNDLGSALGDDPDGRGSSLAYTNGSGPRGHGRLDPERDGAGQWPLGPSGGSLGEWWRVEPDVGRVAHGVPARVDRLRSLGNAVVPQVVQFIGERLMAHANR